MIDDHYIYVFVRQDISIPEQLVHAAHAAYHAGNLAVPLDGIPNLVVIGLPHVGSLAKAARYLKDSGIDHYIWNDPDTAYGPTAIATQPLSRQAKDALKKYRLYSLGTSVPAGTSACSVTADEGAKAAVAQEREHPVSNGEVGGSSPSCGSNSGTCC